MYLASDNTSGAAPEILAAMTRANDGYAIGYGVEAALGRVRAQVRTLFEAPEAAIHLVATGTAANALSIALTCPPWGAVFCHQAAHIADDECGAPEFFTGGAKLVLVDGDQGKMTPEALSARIALTGNTVHGVQKGMVSITNLTEAGTVYTPAEITALTAVARTHGLPCHMDGARFANALVATGATPAQMTWRAGVDILSLGGTKNGCLGVEAVVLFDPAKSRELELRRKRAGHLLSKHRFLSAQMEAFLKDDLWLRLAAQANAMGARLADGLARIAPVALLHPTPANMLFTSWPKGTNAALRATGAIFYGWDEAEAEAARLVSSWSTTETDVDRFLNAVRQSV